MMRIAREMKNAKMIQQMEQKEIGEEPKKSTENFGKRKKIVAQKGKGVEKYNQKT